MMAEGTCMHIYTPLIVELDGRGYEGIGDLHVDGYSACDNARDRVADPLIEDFEVAAHDVGVDVRENVGLG